MLANSFQEQGYDEECTLYQSTDSKSILFIVSGLNPDMINMVPTYYVEEMYIHVFLRKNMLKISIAFRLDR